MVRSALKRLTSLITWINGQAFGISCFLAIALVLLVTGQVVSRYLFNVNSVALQELQWHLFGAIITLSVPYALFLNAHVRVDVISNRLSQSLQKLINAFGYFLLIPLGITLSYYGWVEVIAARSFVSSVPDNAYTLAITSDRSFLYPILAPLESFIRSTLIVGESSPDPGGLEARWIVRSLFPLSMLLLSLQSLALLIDLFTDDSKEAE